MKPWRGENPPFISNSRSQSCRGVRSSEGHSFEAERNSSRRFASTIRFTRVPPWGGFKCSVLLFIVKLEPELCLLLRFFRFLRSAQTITRKERASHLFQFSTYPNPQKTEENESREEPNRDVL